MMKEEKLKQETINFSLIGEKFLSGHNAREISRDVGVSYSKVLEFLKKNFPNEYANPPRKIILSRFQRSNPSKEELIIAGKLGKRYPSSVFWKNVTFEKYTFSSVMQVSTEGMIRWIDEKWKDFNSVVPPKEEPIKLEDKNFLDGFDYEPEKRNMGIRDILKEKPLLPEDNKYTFKNE